MKVTDFEKAYDLLKKYTGTNNQILYLQYKTKTTNYPLSDFDVTYVINNFDYIPCEINKLVKISSDYGEILKKKYELDFSPEKIIIKKIIGEMGESYHCYAQYRKSVAPSLMYIKKRYLLNPIEKKQNMTVNLSIDDEK